MRILLLHVALHVATVAAGVTKANSPKDLGAPSVSARAGATALRGSMGRLAVRFAGPDRVSRTSPWSARSVGVLVEDGSIALSCRVAAGSLADSMRLATERARRGSGR